MPIKQIFNHSVFLLSVFSHYNRLNTERRNTEAIYRYFWRTYDQKEIDLIEEQGGQLLGFEFKWSGAIKKVTAQEFLAAYPKAEIKTISQETFVDFVTTAPPTVNGLSAQS